MQPNCHLMAQETVSFHIKADVSKRLTLLLLKWQFPLNLEIQASVIEHVPRTAATGKAAIRATPKIYHTYTYIHVHL